MPKYRTTIPTFIAPEYLPAGKVFLWDGEPSLTYEPLDAEAEAAMEALYKAKPHALINPFDSLKVNGGVVGDVEPPTLKVLADEKPEEDIPNLGTLAQPGKAQPGVTAGGKALDIKGG